MLQLFRILLFAAGEIYSCVMAVRKCYVFAEEFLLLLCCAVLAMALEPVLQSYNILPVATLQFLCLKQASYLALRFAPCFTSSPTTWTWHLMAARWSAVLESMLVSSSKRL